MLEVSRSHRLEPRNWKSDMKKNQTIACALKNPEDWMFIKEWSAKHQIAVSELIYKALLEYFSNHSSTVSSKSTASDNFHVSSL